jgi:hypothetical protein
VGENAAASSKLLTISISAGPAGRFPFLFCTCKSGMRLVTCVTKNGLISATTEWTAKEGQAPPNGTHTRYILKLS